MAFNKFNSNQPSTQTLWPLWGPYYWEELSTYPHTDIWVWETFPLLLFSTEVSEISWVASCHGSELENAETGKISTIEPINNKTPLNVIHTEAQHVFKYLHSIWGLSTLKRAQLWPRSGSRKPKSSIRQSQLHNSWVPIAKLKCETLVQKLLRISWQWQQNVKATMGFSWAHSPVGQCKTRAHDADSGATYGF